MLERDVYPAGVPCWVDVPAPDPEAAMRFYGGVLGWEFTREGAPGAPGWDHVALRDDRPVAGLATGQGDWRTYVAVDDADAAATVAAERGGSVTVAPADLGSAGRMAEVADPAGARLRLWQAHEHAGARLVNLPGSWSSSDLRSDDRAEAFYGALFGWEATDEQGWAMWRLPGYGDFLAQSDPGLRERHAQAGVPPGFSDMVAWLLPGDGPAAWPVTFGTDDPDGAAARASELGGEVVVPPFDAPPVRLTVLRDPGGATFSLGHYKPEAF